MMRATENAPNLLKFETQTLEPPREYELDPFRQSNNPSPLKWLQKILSYLYIFEDL